MKNILTTKWLVAFLLIMSCTAQVQAEINNIKEIRNADLGALAQENSRENKQTMVIYYKDNCTWCDQLKSAQSPATDSGFRIYKTDTSMGFDITCPNGEYLQDHEFMQIKGITHLPAAVITDNSGNVIHVENGLANENELATLIRQREKRLLANH